MTPLEQYLADEQLTQEQFAALVGSTQGTIARFLPRGSRPPLRRPSLDLAVKIERVTNGTVPVECWATDAGSYDDASPPVAAE